MKSIIALFNSILHELTNKGRKGKWMSNIYKIDASLFDVGFFTFHGHGSQSVASLHQLRRFCYFYKDDK